MVRHWNISIKTEPNYAAFNRKKEKTRDRLSRDPGLRDAFLTEARNMYMQALKFKPELEQSINTFEQILGSDLNTYEFKNNEADELDIFEQILDAYDNQQ